MNILTHLFFLVRSTIHDIKLSCRKKLYLKKWKKRYAELSLYERSKWNQWCIDNSESKEVEFLKESETLMMIKNTDLVEHRYKLNDDLEKNQGALNSNLEQSPHPHSGVLRVESISEDSLLALQNKFKKLSQTTDDKRSPRKPNIVALYQT